MNAKARRVNSARCVFFIGQYKEWISFGLREFLLAWLMSEIASSIAWLEMVCHCINVVMSISTNPGFSGEWGRCSMVKFTRLNFKI